MREAAVGFDIGTSSIKCAIADIATGKIVEGRTWNYPEGSEILPGVVPLSMYEEALTGALRELKADYRLRSVALTTAMYSVCRNTPGGVVAYQWNSLWDRKPEIEEEMTKPLIDSGCRVDTIFPGYKLYTLKPEERASFLPYDIGAHLVKYLTGTLATDYIRTSTLGFFDARKRCWNLELVRKLGFREEDLPLALPHNKAVGKISLQGFENDDIIIAPGLGDGPSASYACKEISSLCGNIGTSMAIRTITKNPDFSYGSGLWNFAFDDEYFATGGISSNACKVFHWLEDINQGRPGDTLPDAHEVLFFPWLHGERTPYWSSDLRGTITGLSIGDGTSEILGAAIRAVGFTFCQMERLLEHVVDEREPLVLAGGGTNIRPLIDVIAGCIKRDIVLLKSESYLGGTGAAFSAAEAAGIEIHPDIEVSETIKPTHLYERELDHWIEQSKRVSDWFRR